MKAGDYVLYGTLAEQKEGFQASKWFKKFGEKTVIGIVVIFIARAAIEVLIQNFLHR